MAEPGSVEAPTPYLVEQWHPMLSRGLRPSRVQVSRSRLVWRLGPCGHSWQESPTRRVCRSAGCPVCTSVVATRGHVAACTQSEMTPASGLVPPEPRTIERKLWTTRRRISLS